MADSDIIVSLHLVNHFISMVVTAVNNCTAVGHSTHNPEMEGSNPVPGARGGVGVEDYNLYSMQLF